jgi:hypothetical protein
MGDKRTGAVTTARDALGRDQRAERRIESAQRPLAARAGSQLAGTGLQRLGLSRDTLPFYVGLTRSGGFAAELQSVRILALVAALLLGGAAGALLVDTGRPLGPLSVPRLATPPTARVVVTSPAPKPVTAPTRTLPTVLAPSRPAAVTVRRTPPIRTVRRTVTPAPAQKPAAPTSSLAPAATTTQPKTAPRLSAPQSTKPLPPGLAKHDHVPPGQAKKEAVAAGRAETTHVPPGQAKKLSQPPEPGHGHGHHQR